MTMACRARIGRPGWNLMVLAAVSVVLLMWAIQLSPIPQSLEYHDFADQRPILGVPHFWNVVSNLPFAIVGAYGLWWLARSKRTGTAVEDRRELLAYAVFFGGELLTCFGSGYYHAGPTNDTLIWDRLVFSLMLTSVSAIVVTEFLHGRAGRLLLVPLVVLGIYSVVDWARSEAAGSGDLRLYLAVQFYPVLMMPLVILLFRSRYTYAWTFAALWVLYAMAKIAELSDRGFFEWTGFWSGHTIKHVLAAVASYAVLFGLQHRRLAPVRHVVTDTGRRP